MRLKKIIGEIKSKESIGELLLMEARAKQFYYHGFDEITKNKDFVFEKEWFAHQRMK